MPPKIELIDYQAASATRREKNQYVVCAISRCIFTASTLYHTEIRSSWSWHIRGVYEELRIVEYYSPDSFLVEWKCKFM